MTMQRKSIEIPSKNENDRSTESDILSCSGQGLAKSTLFKVDRGVNVKLKSRPMLR